jgi:uncharacterized protein
VRDAYLKSVIGTCLGFGTWDLGLLRRPRVFATSVALLVCAFAKAQAAEVIPPKPAAYFNDYAGVVSKSAASRFNEQLAQFERETSNQVVVAVFPKMQSDDDVAAYAQRVADSWGIGTKAQRNGVLLIVFVADRKISIQVGYGLEGALPDLIAYDIRANQITPRFRNGDFEGGLAAGIDGIEKAIRGEYKGSGKTIAEQRRRNRGTSPSFFWFIIFFIILSLISRMMRRLGGYSYSSRRRGPVFIPMGFGGGGGGGWSSGGGGFSGFSGGGGSFGGGGSSGSW